MSEAPWFRNAREVCADYDPREYHKQPLPRGHRDYVMTRGQLMKFNWCPAGWINGAEDESSKATEFGNGLETVVLSKHHFFERIAICPSAYTNKKGGQSLWKNDRRIPEVAEWLNENEGKLILKADVNGQIHAAAKRLEEDERIGALLVSSDTQVLVTGEYHDSATKIVVPVKALIDLVPRIGSPYQKCIADLKTARNAAPGIWGRVCFEDDLHVQAAWNMDLYVAATGEDRTDWLHVIVENRHPYEPARRIMESKFRELGRNQYLNALQRYCRCLATGYWPGYDDEGDTLEGWGWTYLEAWMEARANGRVMDLPPLPKQEPEPEEEKEDLIP